MSWGDTHAKLVAQLCAKRGQWAPNVPKMTAADAVAMLALYVASIVSAIERACDGVGESAFVDSEGIVTDKIRNAGFLKIETMRTLAAQDYVSKAQPYAGVPWVRSMVRDTEPTFQPYRLHSLIRDDQSELVTFVRQTMADYQRALDGIAIGLAISKYADVPWSSDAVKLILKKLVTVGSDLDVLAENPPTTLTEDLRGALSQATDASEAALKDVAKGTGKVAAELGNVAGDIAGNFAEGFLGQASLVTIALLVGWVAYKRYL